MKTVILALFILLSTPFSLTIAQADEAAEAVILPTLGTTADDAKPLRQSMTDRSVRSIDHLHIQLNNGRVVELAGITIPQQGGYTAGDQALRAKEFLDRLFEKNTSQEVILYQTSGSGKGRVNRMGHDLAHVVRKDGNVWLQGALLANGLAQAWPTPENPELAEKMFALEDQAIASGKGLWAKDSAYRLVQANEPISFLDRFAVVEGVVTKIATINNVIYLNFGDDYRKDFTVGFPASLRQVLGRQGIDVFKLQGQRLRVRGWMRFYNGPYIELEHPVLLQRISGKTDDQSSAAP